MALLAAAVVTGLVRVNVAGPAGAHRSFLGGPWELVVKMGLEGDGLRFPLTVSDESKPQKFDAVLPIMGTPIQVKLEEYIPDLTWETVGVEHPDGGIVAKLAIKGRNLQQDIWLSPANPGRQSISSRIGSVAIRRFHNPDTAETLVRELTHPKAVGVLTIWPEDSNRPFECVSRAGEKTVVPGSGYEVTVLEYLPHYSIDTETKEVVSRSKRPVNPAVRVVVSDGRKTFERWLWAKFLSSPHENEELPFRMRYTDFNLGDDHSTYVLAVASGTKVWLLLSNNKGRRAQKAVPGRFYPFADKQYAFSIERIMDGAIIKTQWKNNSERLLRPALVATIAESGESQQTVLELNKPLHHKTRSGTLVLLYKRRPVSTGSR
jgi:hypothetical protein